MEFKQDYLKNWKRTAQETLADQRVKKFLDAMLKEGAQFPTDFLLEQMNSMMKGYAESWASVSDQHKAAGLYKRIAEFIRPGKGLLIDLCCGNGNLLTELDKQNVLGVDINGYCLQLAEQNLLSQGRDVQLYPDSYISFHPDKGFMLRPVPILKEADLNTTNLICDDVRDLRNTMRVLYNQGTKADTVLFTLSGGRSYQAIEFMSLLREGHGAELGTDKSMHLGEALVDNIHKICDTNGRLYIALRATGYAFNCNNSLMLEQGDELARKMAEHFSNGDFRGLRAERYSYIHMSSECNGTGIDIECRPADPSCKITPAQEEEVKKHGYCLVLLEMRLL